MKTLISLLFILLLSCAYLVYKHHKLDQSYQEVLGVTEMVIVQCIQLERENKRLKNERDTY